MKKLILILGVCIGMFTASAQNNTNDVFPFRTINCGNLAVNYGYIGAVKTITATSYTVLDNDFLIVINTPTVASVTLPDSRTRVGQIYYLKANSAFTHSVIGNSALTGGNTIDSASSKGVENKKTLRIMANSYGYSIIGYD